MPTRTALAFSVLLALMLAGCGTMSPEMWVSADPAQVQRDSYECEREARTAGSLWMDASPPIRLLTGIKSTHELYKECMAARGYQRKESRSALPRPSLARGASILGPPLTVRFVTRGGQHPAGAPPITGPADYRSPP